ncbi:MAG TPA: DUF6746 family protein [Nevskiaceae bacterium]|nr:DUF6746 family protein [Nevskiaceae bacterium]
MPVRLSRPSRRWLPALGLALLLPLSSPLRASERPDHFKGQPAPTLAAALQNLAETNREVERLLARPDLRPTDLARVHELTYTLETALQKIQAELVPMAASLEALHQASERADTAAARQHGAAYLQAAEALAR